MARYAVHSPGLASRQVGTEEVVVSPRAGKVWAFNAAGAFFWELADGALELEELGGMLAAARGIDRGQALEEIEAFTDDLVARGLLSWRQVPSAGGARARRAAERPPRELAEPPRVSVEEPLQVLAGGCDSNHNGNPGACMTFGNCATIYS
jgi:hypothetical protein